MYFADDAAAEHEADDGRHERQVSGQSGDLHQRQVTGQPDDRPASETWPPSAGQAAGSAAIARAPHVSLFSPGLPAMSPPAAPDAAPRPLSSLAAAASMTKRTSRLKLGDTHPPTVQLQTHIPAVQKSGDDPSTPLDTPGKKRTTLDLVGHEYATVNSLSGLFASSASSAMASSRAPSYSHATGPLYLRGPSSLPNARQSNPY